MCVRNDEDLNRAQEEEDDEDEDDKQENKGHDTEHVLGNEDGKHIIRIGGEGSGRLSCNFECRV